MHQTNLSQFTAEEPGTTTHTLSSAHSPRSWSAYQLAVFRDIADGRGHTFVGAVAGSGKSTTLVEGLNHVPEGLKVLYCTFGREATESLQAKLSKENKERVECSTLHSYGGRQISRAFGYSKERLNNDKTYILIKALAKDVVVAKDVQVALSKCVSLCKATLAETREHVSDLIDDFGIDFLGDDVPQDATEEQIEELRNVFIRRTLGLLKRSAEVTDIIDFDDMIWLPVKLNLRVWQFDRVFIDETQDLNACQVELALRACKSNGRILAVGDERQAIYGFRGADENAVKKLVDRLRAKTLLLSVCYRCPKAVVHEAQKYVPAIECSPTAAEGQVLSVNTKYMEEHVQPGDFILSRTNAPLISLCLGFLAEGRKAMVAGRDLGKNLSSLIKKSKCSDVKTFLIFLEGWAQREIHHLMDRTPPKDAQIAIIQDKAACLVALCEGAQSLNEVEARITALFADKPKNAKDYDGGRIVLSTTHKAKGLERKNVFLLRDTYLRTRAGQDGVSTEEVNLFYVACTRAMENLYMVRDEKGV